MLYRSSCTWSVRATEHLLGCTVEIAKEVTRIQLHVFKFVRRIRASVYAIARVFVIKCVYSLDKNRVQSWNICVIAWAVLSHTDSTSHDVRHPRTLIHTCTHSKHSLHTHTLDTQLVCVLKRFVFLQSPPLLAWLPLTSSSASPPFYTSGPSFIYLLGLGGGVRR